MAKLNYEVKEFSAGLLSNADPNDIPDGAALDSLNISPLSEMGSMATIANSSILMAGMPPITSMSIKGGSAYEGLGLAVNIGQLFIYVPDYESDTRLVEFIEVAKVGQMFIEDEAGEIDVTAASGDVLGGWNAYADGYFSVIKTTPGYSYRVIAHGKFEGAAVTTGATAPGMFIFETTLSDWSSVSHAAGTPYVERFYPATQMAGVEFFATSEYTTIVLKNDPAAAVTTTWSSLRAELYKGGYLWGNFGERLDFTDTERGLFIGTPAGKPYLLNSTKDDAGRQLDFLEISECSPPISSTALSNIDFMAIVNATSDGGHVQSIVCGISAQQQLWIIRRNYDSTPTPGLEYTDFAYSNMLSIFPKGIGGIVASKANTATEKTGRFFAWDHDGWNFYELEIPDGAYKTTAGAFVISVTRSWTIPLDYLPEDGYIAKIVESPNLANIVYVLFNKSDGLHADDAICAKVDIAEEGSIADDKIEISYKIISCAHVTAYTGHSWGWGPGRFKWYHNDVNPNGSTDFYWSSDNSGGMPGGYKNGGYADLQYGGTYGSAPNMGFGNVDADLITVDVNDRAFTVSTLGTGAAAVDVISFVVSPSESTKFVRESGSWRQAVQLPNNQPDFGRKDGWWTNIKSSQTLESGPLMVHFIETSTAISGGKPWAATVYANEAANRATIESNYTSSIELLLDSTFELDMTTYPALTNQSGHTPGLPLIVSRPAGVEGSTVSEPNDSRRALLLETPAGFINFKASTAFKNLTALINSGGSVVDIKASALSAITTLNAMNFGQYDIYHPAKCKKNTAGHTSLNTCKNGSSVSYNSAGEAIGVASQGHSNQWRAAYYTKAWALPADWALLFPGTDDGTFTYDYGWGANDTERAALKVFLTSCKDTIVALAAISQMDSASTGNSFNTYSPSYVHRPLSEAWPIGGLFDTMMDDPDSDGATNNKVNLLVSKLSDGKVHTSRVTFPVAGSFIEGLKTSTPTFRNPLYITPQAAFETHIQKETVHIVSGTGATQIVEDTGEDAPITEYAPLYLPDTSILTLPNISASGNAMTLSASGQTGYMTAVYTGDLIIRSYSEVDHTTTVPGIPVGVPYGPGECSVGLTMESAGDGFREAWDSEVANLFDDKQIIQYNTSLLYDGYQEGPLMGSPVTWKVDEEGSLDGVSGDYKQGTNAIKINVNISIENPRVTHICIYRRENTAAHYRLVEQLPLDNRWDTQPADAEGNVNSNLAATAKMMAGLTTMIFDKGKAGISYEALTGMPASLRTTIVDYAISEPLAGYLFVAKGRHESIDNCERFIFRSQPNKFSMYNWSQDYVGLPEAVLALSSAYNRLFAFSAKKMYQIDPSNLVVEHTHDGQGIASRDGVMVMNGILYTANKNGVYMYGSGKFKLLTKRIQKVWQKLYSDYPEVVPMLQVDTKHNCLISFFRNKGSNSVDPTPNYAFAFSLDDRRWDKWAMPYNIQSTCLDIDGNILISAINNDYKVLDNGTVVTDDIYETVVEYPFEIQKLFSEDTTKALSWVSKKFSLGEDSRKKKFKKVKIKGNNISLTKVTIGGHLLAGAEGCNEDVEGHTTQVLCEAGTNHAGSGDQNLHWGAVTVYQDYDIEEPPLKQEGDFLTTTINETGNTVQLYIDGSVDDDARLDSIAFTYSKKSIK